MSKVLLAKEMDIAVLHELLECDADSGTLFWKPRSPAHFHKTDKSNSGPLSRKWNSQFAGKPALTSDSIRGYKTGRILCIKFTAHRVIWAMTHGYWPSVIDHINGDKTDNRIANLREVTQQENQKNAPMRRDNRSGFVGVKPFGEKWLSTIGHKRRNYHLGVFPTLGEAVSARKAAEIRFGFHPNHGRRTHA